MAIARGRARPWIANTFLVIMAVVFSVCGGSLTQALDVRTRGQMLTDDMPRFVATACLGARVSAQRIDEVLAKHERFRPLITCTFVVDGRPYDATSEFNAFGRYTTKADAIQAGERWLATHTPLTAYYDPLGPAHATLSRSIEYSVTGQIALSIIGLVIGLCLWFAILRKIYLRVQRWREARKRPPPDEPIPSARVV